MPRKAAQVPGAIAEAPKPQEASEAPAPVSGDAEYEAAQAKANRTGRAVLTSRGWVCAHPSSQPVGKR